VDRAPAVHFRPPENQNQPARAPVEARDGARAPQAKNGFAAFANSNFHLLQKEWVQLSPYGDFPHAQGLQRVTFEAAREMERRFASLAARAARLFAGAPMFIGHPDVPQLANQFPDRKAYGWIMALEARPDGLYGQMKWSPAGLELLQNGHYKFLSPYWEARPVANENNRDVFEPVELISAGLTNDPNLPVLPLANTSAPAPHAAAASNSRAQVRLASIALHTTAHTENLGARKPELGRFYNRRAKLRDLVNAKVQRGLPYDEAWSEVKSENPGLFV
jgi:phage I-like protein